jgi:hypothetical protein
MGERLPEALRISAIELLRQQNLLGDTGAARLAAISRAGIGVPAPAPAADAIQAPRVDAPVPGQGLTAIDFRGADASVYVASVFGATAGSGLRAGAEPSPLRPSEVDREFPLPVEDVAELRGEQLQLETERRDIEERHARIPEQQELEQRQRIEAIQRRLLEIESRLSSYGIPAAATRFAWSRQQSSPISSGHLFRARI